MTEPHIRIINVFQSKKKTTIGLAKTYVNEDEIKKAIIKLIENVDTQMRYILSGWSLGGRIACDIASYFAYKSRIILALMLHAPIMQKKTIVL